MGWKKRRKKKKEKTLANTLTPSHRSWMILLCFDGCFSSIDSVYRLRPDCPKIYWTFVWNKTPQTAFLLRVRVAVHTTRLITAPFLKFHASDRFSLWSIVHFMIYIFQEKISFLICMICMINFQFMIYLFHQKIRCLICTICSSWFYRTSFLGWICAKIDNPA